MIKQLKLGFSMMRYTYGMKMCVIIAGICLLFGFAAELFQVGITGALLFIVGGIWAIQLISSLGVSSMIKTSKYAKAIETAIPAWINFAIYFVCYVVVIACKLPRLFGASEEIIEHMVNELLVYGIAAVVIMVFCGIAYKLFVISTIAIFVVCFGVNLLVGSSCLPDIKVSFGAAAVIGFVCLVVGALLQYGVSVLLYRVPLSKNAQLRGLQKYM